jgi:signal peptidase
MTGLAVLGSVAGWWRIETVLSGSMQPAIHPGDLELLRPEATDDITVGQVVAFHPPHEQITVTHRVVDVQHDNEGVWITTKGDANNAADPWGRIRVGGSRVWVVRHVVPRAGSLNTFVKEPAIRLVLLTAVVLLGIGVALDAIWRS